jgi:hypothetical protein
MRIEWLMVNFERAMSLNSSKNKFGSGIRDPDEHTIIAQIFYLQMN